MPAYCSRSLISSRLSDRCAKHLLLMVFDLREPFAVLCCAGRPLSVRKGLSTLRVVARSYTSHKNLLQDTTEGICTDESTCAPYGGGREGMAKDRNLRGGPDDLAWTGVRSGIELKSDIPPTI